MRTWRAERLLSVRAPALAVGVSTKAITEIEHIRQPPSFRMIRRLADALEVQPWDVTEFAAAINQAAERQEPA